jgi:hypothetical protein
MTLIEYLITDFILKRENTMTPEQFCYWLQGIIDRTPVAPNHAQWANISDQLHLTLHSIRLDPNPPFEVTSTQPGFEPVYNPTFVRCYD